MEHSFLSQTLFQTAVDGPMRSLITKSFIVLQDQPSSVPPPSMESMRRARGPASTWELAPRKRNGSGRSSFSVRKRLLSNKSTSRRPQISAPLDFRHVYSGTSNFPNYGGPQMRLRPRSFRPLELSIYQPNNQLSPMIPHFDYPSPPVTPPQRAITRSNGSGDSYTLSHERSISSLSFHVPRRPTNTGSVFDSPRSDVISRPSPARVRAYTSPEGQAPIMDDLIERVATAMLERDKLQEQIEDVIERQSIYVSSRPSTATGMRPGTARSIMDMEPLPDVPALPPDAPSFSERLSFDRPQTAPAKPAAHSSHRGRSFTEASAAFGPSPLGRKMESRIPPPPLPLRLRPPLRKKKSFSRVSTWLGFPGDPQHHRDISLESITNQPMPIQANEGFYQVAASLRRSSFESDETVSDWTSDAEAEVQTVPTSWSPSSSATIRAVDPLRTVVFGQAPHRESAVGVAF
ncbi:hypothetical protein BJ170DRAFT_249380 [Xylariales sp. AK1849]|nr:hypothetical protein BJ170DRAFT_249380 [Xylariales sp. AK1849]